MASLFRARRPAEEGGSGGKILRGRRQAPTPRASPYARPPPPLLPSPPPPAGSPRWLLGLVSGAGKLISSVFRSDSSSSSSASSSDYSSDDDDDCSPRSDEEDIDAPKELHGFNQGLKKPEVITGCMEGSQAIVTISETKLTIEKLLAQETFSRDECDRLTKLIQSRVVDSPSEIVQDGAERGITYRGTGKSVDPSGAWLSLKQNMDLAESVQYSPSGLSYPSPRIPAFRACTPDSHSAAVIEAKKWLEDKKLSSNSKLDSVCGPCTLNTDMLHYDIDDEVVSPVDLAKSYMQSLPPWQSPGFGSSGVKSPMPSRVDLCMDDRNHATTSNSLPPFKDFKRKYLSDRLRESSDDNRRVRMKLAENILESHGFKQIDSREKLFQNEKLKILSAADERGQDVLGTEHHSCSSQSVDTSCAPAKSLADLHAEDHCSKDALNLPDKTVNTNPLTLTGKSISIIMASEPKEAVKAVESTKETLLPNISSSDPTESKIESEPKSPLGLDENKDVIEPLLTEQEDKFDTDIPHGSLISASTSVVHGGDPMSEKVVVTPEGNKSTKSSDADDVTNLDNNVQTSSVNTTMGVEISEANNTTELNLDSDAKAQDGNLYAQHGADGLANEFSTTGGSAESNANPQSFCEEDQSYTHCSINCEQTMGISEGTYELLRDAAIGTPAITGRSENGTKMKSVERVLVEPQPTSSRRRKRAVVKVRRGRGRGAK